MHNSEILVDFVDRRISGGLTSVSYFRRLLPVPDHSEWDTNLGGDFAVAHMWLSLEGSFLRLHMNLCYCIDCLPGLMRIWKRIL